MRKRMNLGKDLTPLTKINRNGPYTYIMVKYKTIRILENIIRGNICDLRFGEKLLVTISKDTP